MRHQQVAVLGVLGEVPEAVPEHTGDGVEPGHVEEEAHLEQLPLADGLAIDLGGDEIAHQVVTGFGPALGQQLAEIAVDGLPRRGADGAVGILVVAGVHERVDPPEEHVGVLHRGRTTRPGRRRR